LEALGEFFAPGTGADGTVAPVRPLEINGVITRGFIALALIFVAFIECSRPLGRATVAQLQGDWPLWLGMVLAVPLALGMGYLIGPRPERGETMPSLPMSDLERSLLFALFLAWALLPVGVLLLLGIQVGPVGDLPPFVNFPAFWGLVMVGSEWRESHGPGATNF
jgi:hypothetical protein